MRFQIILSILTCNCPVSALYVEGFGVVKQQKWKIVQPMNVSSVMSNPNLIVRVLLHIIEYTSSEVYILLSSTYICVYLHVEYVTVGWNQVIYCLSHS